jgi:PhnB protein
MRIGPHLTFNGDCRAAFLDYQRILGGEIATLMTYGESPMASHIDPKWHERIVHATLQFDSVELAGADVLPHDYHRPQGFFVIVSLESAARAAQIFSALAVGGEVRLAFQATFWSPGFGVLVDRYGVPWEINTQRSAARA